MSSSIEYGHPLEPLSVVEIEAALDVLRDEKQRAASTYRYLEVQLQEPSKALYYDAVWQEDSSEFETMPRLARILAFCTAERKSYVFVIDIYNRKLVNEESLSNVQMPMDGEEYALCEKVAKNYPPMVKALEKRGILDMENVMFDPWCVGYFSPQDSPSMRLNYVIPFYRRGHENDNGYACPIEGIECYIDLFSQEVVRFHDTGDMPLPPEDPCRNFSRSTFKGEYRKDLKPIVITQPEGPSFTVKGSHIQWLDWSFRVGFNAREGLTLHTIKARDHAGAFRKVAYRMSMAEMVVPYGDPKFPHYRKNAFDAGEDGLGRNAHSLEFGCDCIGEIRYLDATFCDYYGRVPENRPNVVCIHEEDTGTLWKHVDWRTGETDVRRGRRLVVSFFCTIANYDYGFFWYFNQSGTIEWQVKATGILSVGALHPREDNHRKYGTTVAQNLFAPIHQHWFVARMDMAVDGMRNRVVEVNSIPETDGPHNPHKNAFYPEHTVLKTEKAARRNMSLETSRVWQVESSSTVNAHGSATAWKLMPGGNCQVITPNAMYLRRAGFVKHHIWVTPYDEAERFPGGDYPNQNPGIDGLEKWTEQDRDISDTDIVLWYCFGFHHIPRPEDWPIMPIELIGFSLEPFGFFDRSPVIDVPPPRKPRKPRTSAKL